MLNPHLPESPSTLDPSHTRRYRNEGGEAFYQACLEFSQSLWQQGKPAQAILQLNKAAMIPECPTPFAALVWYLINRKDAEFIGNPVRHFQHLASRMSGENATLRSWRAWACFHLSEEVLPPKDYPRDTEQIKKEALKIPSMELVEKNLTPSDSSALPAAKALARKHPAKRP